jgi:tetratricopeptide (TPR) repeat protein
VASPRTLFLLHEQRQWYWEEPAYLELYTPMVNSGGLGEVRSHPYQRELRWLRKKAEERASNQSLPEIDAAICEDLTLVLDAVVREFNPALVVYALTWPMEAIPPRVLKALKEMYRFKLFSVIWDYDESNERLMNYDKDVIAVSDLVAVADSFWRADRIRRREGLYANFTNVEAVRFMPMVADPVVFQPSPNKRHDVTIAGSSEGYRIEVYERLVAAGIRVNRVGGLMPTDAYLSHSEYARALAESRIVVNTQSRQERVQLKGRVGQVLAAGSLLMEQWSPESERFLESLGLGDLMWRTVDELILRIRDWLKRPSDCDARAAQARKHYIGANTPQAWTALVLDTLELNGGEHLAETSSAPDALGFHEHACERAPERAEPRARPGLSAQAEPGEQHAYVVAGSKGEFLGKTRSGRFGVSYENHGKGGVHIEDITTYIRNALRTAGEEAEIIPNLLPDATNVLLENFTRAQVKYILEFTKAKNARLIIVATEFTDGRSFNPHVLINPGGGHYHHGEYWVERFEAFKEIAIHADAIWCLSEYQLPQYQKLFPDLPVLNFPIGFDRLLPTSESLPTAQRDIDVLFTGNDTPHRLAVIAELEKRLVVVKAPVSTPTESRAGLIRRTKACLHINLHPDALYSSVMRHHTLIMQKTPVLSERALLPGALDEFIVQFDSADFVADTIDYIKSGQWLTSGVEAYERYRRERPIEQAVRQLVADSFSDDSIRRRDDWTARVHNVAGDSTVTGLRTRVLLIVPTRGRPHRIMDFYDAFVENSSITDLVFALDDDDESQYPRIDGAKYEVNPRLRLAGTFNLVARKYADEYDYIMCMTDEHRIRTKDWDKLLTNALSENDGWGVAYGNDLVCGERMPTAHMFSAKIVQTLGYITPPELTHLYSDNFSLEMGKGLGALYYKDDVVIQDVHFGMDGTLRESNSPEMFLRDHAAFSNYMVKRFPSDVEKLLRVRYQNVVDDYLTVPGVVQKLQWEWCKNRPAEVRRLSGLDRAIVLLNEALKLEPENHSYWFHLARCYQQAGRLEEAAQTYAKRAALGAWDPHAWYFRTEAHTRRPVVIGRQGREEEAWYAGLSAARCWRTLRRDDDFIREALAAFDRRPQRAEPLYDLARYYREIGMNNTSLLFCEAGLAVSCPEDGALFVEDFVYTAGLYEEYSMAANYSLDPVQKARGHSVCNWLALNRDIPERPRNLARHNLFFYAGSARAILPSFISHPVQYTPPSGYRHLSPSVASLAGRVVLLQPIVDTGAIEVSAQMPSGHLNRVRNFMLGLSADFSIESSKELFLRTRSPGPQVGSERDLVGQRLFAWRTGTWCLAVPFEHSADPQYPCLLGRVDCDAQGLCQLVEARELCPEDLRQVVRDWIPQVGMETLRIIYRCDPTSVMDENGQTIAITAPSIAAEQFEGSSQAVPFGGGSLALIREASGHYGGHHHRFVWFSSSGVLRGVSKSFFLNERGIETVGGLAWHPDGCRLLVSYSVDGHGAWIATVEQEDIVAILEDVERLLPKGTSGGCLAMDPFGGFQGIMDIAQLTSHQPPISNLDQLELEGALDRPRQVRTWQGTVIFIDPQSGQLRHGPEGSVPRNIVLERHEFTARLTPVSADVSHMIEGPEYEFVAVGRAWWLGFGLRHRGLFLCAEDDGTVTLSRPNMSTWETFRLGV